MHGDEPLLVSSTVIVRWPVPPLVAPRAKPRLAGWQVPAVPAALADPAEPGLADAAGAPLAGALGAALVGEAARRSGGRTA